MIKKALAASFVLFMVSGSASVFADATYPVTNTPMQLSQPTQMPITEAQPVEPYGQPAVIPTTPPAYSAPLQGHLTSIPKGTIMMVKLDHPVSSYSSKIGDPISATVEADVYQDNQVVVPAGSLVEGEVTGVETAGHIGKSGTLEMQFSTVKTTTGMVIPLRAHVVTSDNTGVIRGDSQQAQVLKTVGTAAGITAAGTLFGVAAGGLLSSVGPGAIFGVAAGGIAGLTYAIVREGKQVVIPSGARLSIVLDQAVGVN